MGWTCTEKPNNVKKYFDDMHTSNEYRKVRVLKSALKNFREYYAAIEVTNEITGEVDVFCSVIKCDYYQEYGEPQISYKEMSDHAGPAISNCPKNILELLTPTDNDYANQWRDKCWSKINMQAALTAQLQHGKKVQFSPAIEFTDGNVHDELYVWKHKRKVRYAPYPTAKIDATDAWSMPSYRIGKEALLRSLVLE